MLGNFSPCLLIMELPIMYGAQLLKTVKGNKGDSERVEKTEVRTIEQKIKAGCIRVNLKNSGPSFIMFLSICR